MRCAKRMGRRERVKFAEVMRASADRGGLCLMVDGQQSKLTENDHSPYLTKSARQSEYKGLLAKLETSSSAIDAGLDRWDHLWVPGGGYFEEVYLLGCRLLCITLGNLGA